MYTASTEPIIIFKGIRTTITYKTKGCKDCKTYNKQNDSFCSTCGKPITVYEYTDYKVASSWEDVFSIVSNENWHIQTMYDKKSFTTSNTGGFLICDGTPIEVGEYVDEEGACTYIETENLTKELEEFKEKHSFLVKLMNDAGLKPKVKYGLYMDSGF